MRAALPPESGVDGRAATGPPLRAVELMHPDGEARSEAALGGRVFRRRPVLRPDPRRGADLLWVAPSARECRTRGWLADAVERIGRELAPDGIAYVLPPAGWRGPLARRLRGAGFRVEPPVAHLAAGAEEDRYLVPLRGGAARFLLASLLPLPVPVRRLAVPLARLPGWRRLAEETWPAVGFVARRAGSREPLAWLRELGAGAPHGVVVASGWRGPGDSVLLHLLAPDGSHAAVAKVARAGVSGDEAGTLARLGGDARAAGAALPRVLGAGVVAGRRAALLTAVPGRPAAERVAGRPGRVGAVLDRLARWLEAWSLATARVAPLGADELEREVLRPLRLLAPLLPDGEAYAARVRSLCERLAGAPVPRVAAHGDLTLHNVLLDRGALGVVDWEAARADGWPLTDLEYAAADAAAAAGGYRDRPRAWAECFLPGGAFSAELAGRRARLADALGVTPAFAELCRQACWLHHAANEHAAPGDGGARPFLGVLRAVAAAGGGEA